MFPNTLSIRDDSYAYEIERQNREKVGKVTDERKIKLQEQEDAQNTLNECKAEREKRLEEIEKMIENKKESLESSKAN